MTLSRGASVTSGKERGGKNVAIVVCIYRGEREPGQDGGVMQSQNLRTLSMGEVIRGEVPPEDCHVESVYGSFIKGILIREQKRRRKS